MAHSITLLEVSDAPITMSNTIPFMLLLSITAASSTCRCIGWSFNESSVSMKSLRCPSALGTPSCSSIISSNISSSALLIFFDRCVNPYYSRNKINHPNIKLLSLYQQVLVHKPEDQRVETKANNLPN
ncbi:hypothetical protein V8G54_011880 [Vigna mungo]|uniref:Uncharacterized protein n=1 Tax=Vigna mungo TaxID=3915 RepID=A0AAQ3S3G8_VIGMU